MKQKLRGILGRSLLSARRSAHFFMRELGNLFYPPFCLICEKSLSGNEKSVCTACWNTLRRCDSPLKNVCDIPIPLKTKLYFSYSIAIFEFDTSVQKLIHEMKYKNFPHLADLFAAEYRPGRLYVHLFEFIDYLIPVPLHPARKRERGYNQAELLAKKIGYYRNIFMIKNALRRVRYTKQQAFFNREERFQNVKNAFIFKSKVAIDNKIIGLVDDVLTTGSTLNECARILKIAGAKQVVGITLVRI